MRTQYVSGTTPPLPAGRDANLGVSPMSSRVQGSPSIPSDGASARVLAKNGLTGVADSDSIHAVIGAGMVRSGDGPG